MDHATYFQDIELSASSSLINAPILSIKSIDAQKFEELINDNFILEEIVNVNNNNNNKNKSNISNNGNSMLDNIETFQYIE